MYFGGTVVPSTIRVNIHTCYALSTLPIWHPLIRLLHRWYVPNHLQPLLNLGVRIQIQPSIRALIQPRKKMSIHGAKPARQNALPATLSQLSFQLVKGPIRLCLTMGEGVLILSRIEVTIPSHLSHHRRKGTDEEKLPFVKVDMVLCGWFATPAPAAWTQVIGFVVGAQEIMDNRTTLPGYDTGVRILKSWHVAILIYLQKYRTVDAVWSITGLPEFDVVWKVEGGENNGYLVRAGIYVVGWKICLVVGTRH